MKLNLFKSSTLLSATKCMLKSIDNSDIEIEHIIVVPDRFSLQAEKMVFEMVKKDSVFNIAVKGLSALASHYLAELGKESQVLGNAEALLLTEQAMINKSDQLISFKKNNINFVHEVQKAIAQFKSCKLAPEDMIGKSNLISSKNKFHDLAVIYQEYQNLLGENLDQNSRLELFTQSVGELDLKNVNFYFAGFDAFTAEVYELLKALLKSAKSINISAVQSLSADNDYIYEKDIHEKLNQIATESGIMIDDFNDGGFLNDKQELIVKNIYSGKIEKSGNDSYFLPLVSSNRQEEVGAVAKIIAKKVREGAKFRDFTVACSSVERYSHLVERIFGELNIPYFIDSAITADKTLLAQVVKTFFGVVLSGYAKENILALIANDIVPIENREQIISEIERLNIDGKGKFKKHLSSKLGSVEKILEDLSTSKTVSDFSKNVKEILSVCEEGFQSAQNYCEDNGYLKEKNINAQAKEIIFDALETIQKFDKEISLKEFDKKFQLVLSFKEVFSVPTYVDSVSVGDATNSYFGDCKTLFLLGCENLPIIVNDSGLISDDDIANVQFGSRIQPSIRMINRRNRFKLFCLLSSASEKLVTSYLTINEEGKKCERPLFVENLMTLFQARELRASILSDLGTENKEIFLSAIGNKKSALRSLARFYRSGKIDNGFVASLSKVLCPDYQSFILNRDDFSGDCDKTFFPKGYTKVTQLENYFSCPFKHFVRYGLKLQENESSEFDARDIGNVCHKMSELYVNTYKNHIKSFSVDMAKNFIDSSLNKILEDLNLLQKVNAQSDAETLISLLKFQCLNILARLTHEISSSQFEFYQTEMEIKDLFLNYKHGKLRLVGKVDRVDLCGDYFRIIDYKTGRVGGIIKDLYYGDKLQLFLYARAVGKILGKKSAGTFYFDSKWDYRAEDEDNTILKGMLISDENALDMFDTNIEEKGKSDIVGISLSKAKKKASKYIGQSISKVPLSCYENYAVKVGNKALDEIGKGYISPKPDEDACNGCKFLGICLHAREKGYRKKGRVSQDDISNLGGVNGESDG